MGQGSLRSSANTFSERAPAGAFATPNLRLRYFAWGKIPVEEPSPSSPDKRKQPGQKPKLFSLVGVKGLEPSTSWSQTRRATNCATPRSKAIITDYNLKTAGFMRLEVVQSGQFFGRKREAGSLEILVDMRLLNCLGYRKCASSNKPSKRYLCRRSLVSLSDSLNSFVI